MNLKLIKLEILNNWPSVYIYLFKQNNKKKAFICLYKDKQNTLIFLTNNY